MRRVDRQRTQQQLLALAGANLTGADGDDVALWLRLAAGDIYNLTDKTCENIDALCRRLYE